jgi:hypothetical protein
MGEKFYNKFNLKTSEGIRVEDFKAKMENLFGKFTEVIKIFIKGPRLKRHQIC